MHRMHRDTEGFQILQSNPPQPNSITLIQNVQKYLYIQQLDPKSMDQNCLILSNLHAILLNNLN